MVLHVHETVVGRCSHADLDHTADIQLHACEYFIASAVLSVTDLHFLCIGKGKRSSLIILQGAALCSRHLSR